MKILYLGEYDPGEIVLAPIKVGKELFMSFKNYGYNVFYLPYFQDGNIYSRNQKLFGFEKITDRVYRTGILPLLSFVIKFKPQLIHINTPGLYYFPLFFLRFLFHYKIISTLHSINRYVIPRHTSIKGFQKFRFLLIEYLLVKFSDYVFVYSNRDKRYISMYYKIRPAKIIIVNNGFNEVNVHKKDFSFRSPLRIAFVGQIDRKEKAFYLLLDTLSILKLQVKLSVYGYDRPVEAVTNIPTNVELQMHDPLGEVEFRQALIVNDIFILPSKYESFSISLLEAMNTGILFLVSTRVGLTERFDQNLKCLVFRNGKTDDLIDRIKFCLEMDNIQKFSLSSEIINFSKNFYWDKISSDYKLLYNNLLI
ncbi:MAG: glycosyltransferase family 4 protein [Ignavibacteria bacterium]|nr:glycosyltransferase family 4 protein [Ignavibacteria bacterium]MBT8392345.1 glycosyltransferase family 4 protein [Ignavibacteria bacterium]NNL22231.1 glycosyltransferase family 4 protein [Ignavibacteriaceae bacterium]